jgi:hypothetical protein
MVSIRKLFFALTMAVVVILLEGVLLVFPQFISFCG